jgi:hypothetical protein
MISPRFNLKKTPIKESSLVLANLTIAISFVLVSSACLLALVLPGIGRLCWVSVSLEKNKLTRFISFLLLSDKMS